MTTKLANILHCYAMGMGIKGISATFELSRNTVRKYVRLFQESGIPMEQLQSMSAKRLEEMFGSSGERERTPSVRQLELEALLPEYAARLTRKGVTVKSLYEEYRREHPGGFRHASFGAYIQRYRLVSRPVGHVEHYAADQLYIDFAGDRLEVVDEQTGEVRSVEVFVAILPCSHYTYCEAVWSQKKEDLIKACENALHFYEGVPFAIVPDNLKSAVTRSNRNEPVINEDFAAFAEHYGCSVYPARVRHQKDKALVENAVKLMYKSVYTDLEGLMFHDLESLNGLRLVTTHQRDDTPYGYTRKEAHNLPGRHGSYEKDLDEVFERATQIDNIVLLYLKDVASQKKYMPQAFRSCRGILALEKTFGQDRLVAACACASLMRVYGYQDVIGILNRGDDADFLPQADQDSDTNLSLPHHKNIRGREYFSKSTTKTNNNNGNK